MMKHGIALLLAALAGGCTGYTGYAGPTPAEQEVFDDATCVVDWKTKRGSPEYVRCRSTLMQNANQQASLDMQRRAALAQSMKIEVPKIEMPKSYSSRLSTGLSCSSNNIGGTVYTNCY